METYKPSGVKKEALWVIPSRIAERFTLPKAVQEPSEANLTEITMEARAG